MLELKVLGTLEVINDGKPLDPPGGLAERLLAVLILREGRPIKADDLIPLLWPGTPPASARASIYNVVSDLKETAANAGLKILVGKTPKGYYIETDNAQFDLRRFNDLLDAASQAIDQKDLEAAWDMLDGALSLWEGDEPLHGLDCPFLTDATSELQQKRLEARLEWCDTGQRLGRHRTVLPLLRRLAKENPANETVHEKLMAALEQAGRPAEALAVYETVSEHLARELDSAPGTGLQSLYRQILRSANDVAGGEAAGNRGRRPEVPFQNSPGRRRPAGQAVSGG